MAKSTTGEMFLHESDPDLHNTHEVARVLDYLDQYGCHVPNDPKEKIATYLTFLEECVNDGIMTGDEESSKRQAEALSIALTERNVAAYARFGAAVARQNGLGNIMDDISEQEKVELLRHIHDDQYEQLLDWFNELAAPENSYPRWFKYWMAENVIRHTAFNHDLKNGKPAGFERRSKGSFVLFPELNRESVAIVYSALLEKIGGDPMNFEYERLRQLLDKASFRELYAAAQDYGFKITDELKAITTGSWHKFPQSDLSVDAEGLSSAIRAYRTGWCTAGRRTAQVQLKHGDFYIWCSTDPNVGDDVVPRIAIRMHGDQIAEVRGIEDGRRQAIEPKLLDIAREKLQTLDREGIYFRKVDDMKRLTELEERIKSNRDVKLSGEELNFLYEYNDTIFGFGYGPDPRIKELKQLRGDNDLSAFEPLIYAEVLNQFKASYSGYEGVTTMLGGNCINEADFYELLEAKDAMWRKQGMYRLMTQQFIHHGAHPTLIATPSLLATWEQVAGIVNTFNRNSVFRPVFAKETWSRYSPKQLSGIQKASDSVRFSIIPSRSTLGLGTASQQAHMLEQLNANHADLTFQLPSVLELVTCSIGRKASDYSYCRGGIFVQHFELPLGNEAISLPATTISSTGSIFFGEADQTNLHENSISIS